MSAIAPDLLAWFAEHQRDMPWRRTAEPYCIWISEIMLQQTQVATVIPYYERFMAEFPTLAALASAPIERVLKRWEGLGYYSRARHLHAAARLIVDHHGGRFPDDWDGVRRLPGVGDYTAGAILSIAFGRAVPAVDGNVVRVIARLFLLQEDVARPATKRAIDGLARDLVPAEAPGDFNQALMELGATICTPTRPRCDRCPVARHCRAQAAGVAETLPVKAKKAAARAVTLLTAVVERDGRYLLLKRPESGIWGGLWAFPATEAGDAGAAAALTELLAGLGLSVALADAPSQTLRHTLTHRQLTIPAYAARVLQGEVTAPEARWVLPEELGEYALPVPFQKLVAALDPGPLFRAAPESMLR